MQAAISSMGNPNAKRTAEDSSTSKSRLPLERLQLLNVRCGPACFGTVAEYTILSRLDSRTDSPCTSISGELDLIITWSHQQPNEIPYPFQYSAKKRGKAKPKKGGDETRRSTPSGGLSDAKEFQDTASATRLLEQVTCISWNTAKCTRRSAGKQLRTRHSCTFRHTAHSCRWCCTERLWDLGQEFPLLPSTWIASAPE